MVFIWQRMHVENERSSVRVGTSGWSMVTGPALPPSRLRCVELQTEQVSPNKEVHPDATVDIVERGSVEELEKKELVGRTKRGRAKFWEYHRLFFQLFTIKGVWNLGELDNDRYPGVKATSLERFLKENPDI